MTNLERLTEELQKLIADGIIILSDGQKAKVDYVSLSIRYEAWYSKALSLITQVTPSRLTDFNDAYKVDRSRKEINVETFTISDFLSSLTISQNGGPAFDHASVFGSKMLRQISIVGGARALSGSVFFDIRAMLRADLLDSDMGAAKELLGAGHVRAAGMICGVVLEAHLQSCCAAREVVLSKKDPGIGDLNEAMKAAGAYYMPMWRLISRLADIRNLCGHKKDRDPKLDEVEDLIAGTDKVIKEVG